MGIWSLPQTKKQAEKLSKLLSKPLPVKGASKKLYDLTGDDDLFDKIAILENEFGPRYDFRDEVKDFIRETVEYYEQAHHAFKNTFEAEALEILKAII